MKLYFVFSAPLSGPIAEWAGGLADLDEVVRSEDEARALIRRKGSIDEHGHRTIAWFNSFDTETLEVSTTEWSEP